MTENSLNKRKHQRHITKDHVIAVCQEGIGRVLNISQGGMALKFINNQAPLSNSYKTNLFCKKTNSLIFGLNLRVVQHEGIRISQYGGYPTQIARAEFHNLSSTQKMQLENFITTIS